MRAALVCLLLCASPVFAIEGAAQNASKVQINSAELSIDKFFNEVERQTGFLVVYSTEDLRSNFNVSLKKTSGDLKEMLDEALAGSKLTYSLSDKYIVLSAAKESASSPKSNSVRGKVVDKAGVPVVGASVLVKGTTVGTSTDLDGNYSIEAAPAATLEFSFIGYSSKEVKVAGQSVVDVVLEDDSIMLDELVMVGYGTSKRSDLTGSVSTVTSRDFADQPASSANSVLTGRIAGVTVKSLSGNPSASPTIRIRGANSIYGGNDPLLVVDGNYSDDMPHNDDIESIEILKDASATAIYGSRGANGVIIVTTKRGNEGKPTIKFNTNISVDALTKKYDVMNAYEFATFNKEIGAYPFTDADIAKFKADPKGTDWQDEILNTALSQDYKLTISGGSKNFKYYISPSYTNREGLMKNTKADRFAINSKLDFEVSDRLSFKVELAGGRSAFLNSGFGSDRGVVSTPMYAALVWSPTETVYDDQGNYTKMGVGTGTLVSPAVILSREDRSFRDWASIVGVMRVKILKGLDLSVNAKAGFSNSISRWFKNSSYTATYHQSGQGLGENLNWLVNAVLNYSNTFGKHSLSALAGYEYTPNFYESFSAEAQNLPMESSKWYNMGSAAPNIGVGSGYSNYALLSYFGRINYNYASRYYITANFRADGSSKFREGNRFGYFPSFSLAWRLSEEAFMKDQTFFQNIKLRGGWGETGNQGVSPYATYATMTSSYGNYAWGTGVNSAGLRPYISGNANLKWETTRQTNVGLDLTFLRSRVNVSLDWYKKHTFDLLAPVSVPAYAGGDSEYNANTTTANVGSVDNQGFEFSINAEIVNTDAFKYDINLNGATNKNKVVSLGESMKIYGTTFADRKLGAVSPFVLVPGEAIGTVYGMKYLGIWQESQAEEAAKYALNPGDYRYDDVDGDGKYTTDDYVKLGNTNPKFTWGFNNHLSYKNWDLNVLFEGAHGQKMLNWTRAIISEAFAMTGTITSREAMDRWSPSNPDAEFCMISNTGKFNAVSSQYLENAGYVKLRNLSISYRLPKKVTGFADFQFSLSAQNLLTLTKYKGYDPEISTTDSNTRHDMNNGMDYFPYPNPKSFSFGISITY